MHIAYLSLESPADRAPGGGIAAYLRAIIPALISAGHRVTVIANGQTGTADHPWGDRVHIVHIRLPGLHWHLSRVPLCSRTVVLPVRHLEWSWAFAHAARRALAADPADVLEMHELGALRLASRPLAPLVIRMHGSDHTFRKYTGQRMDLGARWSHRLDQAVRRRAGMMTAPSRFMAGEIAADLGCPPGRIRVIANPLAPAMLAQALRQPSHQPAQDGEPTVLYTGRMAPVKGVTPLLATARLVCDALPDARFQLAGGWQMPEKPEDLGLGDGAAPIRWLGHVSWDELPALYRRASILVMPSYFESFGISVVEAMAFGLPVVATTAGGLPEVVEDGVTGILVPPGDSRALAEAILRLLRDPGLRRQMGQAGRERVLASYTADRVAAQTLTVYESLLSG